MDQNRREQIIGEWAARLDRWGLAPVSPLLLRMLQPLGFVGSQLVLLGQPLLTLLADVRSLDELSTLLDDPDALEEIERRLNDAGTHAP